MISRPNIPTLGAFVYFEKAPATYEALGHAAVESLLEGTRIPVGELKMSLYKTPRKKGKWRGFKWKAFDEAAGDPLVEAIDLIIGSTDDDVSFHILLELRSNPDPRLRSDSPLQFSFVHETQGDNGSDIEATVRRMLAVSARGATPLFGGCFRSQSFVQANCEVDYPFSYEQEPKEFKERIRVDRKFASDRWTKARRLYPITLLGPKLASQVSAADARNAGALALEEINGSLLIDAYPSVVETWDPEFLKATVELRRWLWPYTIQNPADAIGLGLKLPRR
jgi:hypothetical protein